MKTINIREALLEIDRKTSCQYDLTTLYEACKLKDEDKHQLVKYIASYDHPSVIGGFLESKCDCLSECCDDDNDVTEAEMKKIVDDINDGEDHTLWALLDKADEEDKKLTEDKEWRTNPTNSKEVSRYVYRKILPFDEFTDDNSRYWDFDRCVVEGDDAQLVDKAPAGAKYVFSTVNDQVDIDFFMGRTVNGDVWYVVDNKPDLEESALGAAALALGTAAATGFGTAIGDKVGGKLLGEDSDDFEYENDDWDDGEVGPGKTFFSDGYDWKWIRRVGDVVHLDFDNWAVWMAFRPEEENNPSGRNVVEFFVVDEDTGFLDWGPVETVEEALEFLQSKVNDWEMDESLTEDVDTVDLKSKLETAAREFITDRLGYDDDFVNDYIFVDVKQDQFDDGTEAIKCQIRTELDYEECEQLANALNPIVAAEDKHAYFDMETSNVLVSFLRTDFSEDIVDEAAVAEFAPIIDAVTSMERLRELYQDIRETLADVWTYATFEAVHDLIMNKADELNGMSEAVATAEKDLTSIDGTIASVLNKHKDEINQCHTDQELKTCVIRILNSGECKDESAAEDAIRYLSRLRGGALFSTVATYMIGGQNVINPARDARKRKLTASLDTELTEGAPSQATLDDCLSDYKQNAFGFDGVEDYVETQYPMHDDAFKKAVVDYLKKNESLSEDFVRNTDLDQVVIKVANMLDDSHLGDNWIEVFPTVDAYLIGNGEYGIKLEITGPDENTLKANLHTNRGRIDVKFWNGSEAKCDSAEEIARFIAGECDVLLDESINESVEVNGEVLQYAVINPDGTYVGVPCTSEEEARELAAQREGRVIVELGKATPINEGRMTDRYQKMVKNQFEQEIDASDKSHEIADDGLSFKIVRANGVVLEYNAAEGYTTTEPSQIKESDETEDKPYTYRQVFDELKLETKNFTVKDGAGKYGYESEANHAIKILERHYASVELDRVGSWFQVDFKDPKKSKKEELEEDAIELTADEMKAKYGTDNPDIINTGRPEEDGTVVFKEATATHIYLFPELTAEDIDTLKAYGLKYLGKNHGADASEDNWVVAGTADSLQKYAEKWLGYELHPDYLYDADDFAGDIVEEKIDIASTFGCKDELNDFANAVATVSGLGL